MYKLYQFLGHNSRPREAAKHDSGAFLALHLFLFLFALGWEILEWVLLIFEVENRLMELPFPRKKWVCVEKTFQPRRTLPQKLLSSPRKILFNGAHSPKTHCTLGQDNLIPRHQKSWMWDWVSERINEWAQQSARAERAVRIKQKIENWEWTSGQKNEWPSTYVPILG